MTTGGQKRILTLDEYRDLAYKARPAKRVFMDCAATSSPKPPGLSKAMDEYLKVVRCSLNRDGHTESCASAGVAMQTRRYLAELFGYPDPLHVVFLPSVTFALNLVLKGLLHAGDHAIVGSMEHNAVRRPLHQLAGIGVETDRIPCDRDGRMDADAIEALVRPNTRLLVCLHASNVTGDINPIERIGALCRKHGILFVLDVAQTAGAVPIDMAAAHVDVLCWAGHKSLMGPPGIGGAVMSQEVADRIEPLVSGGSGLFSRGEEMPSKLPLKFEAGTYNTVAIYGLHAALRFIRRVGVERIAARERELLELLQEGIAQIPEARMLGCLDPARKTAVLSVDFPEYDNNAIAYYLDSRYNIATRRGIHCAPDAHEVLGTLANGAVRLSLGYFSTEKQVATAVCAVRDAVREVPKGLPEAEPVAGGAEDF